jgi:hypothetical protein
VEERGGHHLAWSSGLTRFRLSRRARALCHSRVPEEASRVPGHPHRVASVGSRHLLPQTLLAR